MSTHSGPSWIVSEITQQGGAVSGERFMELALYHPIFGYYHRSSTPIGRDGDYVTAPVMTTLFGELLCLQFIEVWEMMGEPKRFTLIEAGPGTGHLAADILKTAQKFPRFDQALEYRLVETSPVLRTMQKERLAPDTGRCAWYNTLAQAGGAGIEGVIFGNEFLDALPVCWLEMTPAGLREVGVQVTAAGDLETKTLPLNHRLDPLYFERMGLNLPVGMRTEVGLQARDWMQCAGEILRRGLVLMIDYGYTAQEYYTAARHRGTLVGHRQHCLIDDPLSYPGEMDLTAHVDFTAMAQGGVAGGLEPCGYTTQGWFFMGLGLLERLEALARARGSVGLGTQIRQTALRLILPEEMGERFKVLSMTAGLPGCPLSGYRLRNQWEALATTPKRHG
ncbi:MAG: SAM-dependent methyltransferase [Magnetococcales bacterium]|nr:SAM-dependent methyltransferase [Magnetococcales bacterium]